MAETDEAALVHRELAAAATGGERWVSVGRLVFSVVIAARHAWVAVGGCSGWVLGSTGAAVALSLATFALLRTRRTLPPIWLHFSVLGDVALATVALAANLVEPNPEFRGLLGTPDWAVLLVIIAASGFRVTPRVALSATVFAAASLSCLVLVERGGRLGQLLPGATMSLLLVLVAGFVAVTVAVRTRALALHTARAGLVARRMRRELDVMLEDHHDVRTHLSAAQLALQQLSREGAGTARGQLERSLAAIDEHVGRIRERALVELATANRVVPTEVEPTLQLAVLYARARAPKLSVVLQVPPELRVMVAGGASVLARVFTNLLVNAVEGDGARGAGRVHVSSEQLGDTVLVTIDDDGPGLASLALPDGRVGLTTKVGGTGIGLALVRAVAAASGGTLELANREAGGARVALRLRAGVDEPAPSSRL